MTNIIKLDKNLSNQIAAWEVVERPVSIIKELLENSIDAGAKNIKIEILDWWTNEIIITDDWIWIERDELKLALEKYTTSKIKTIEDLYNVMTFWFRWEALSSISSVSKFKIISKTKWTISWYCLDSIWWDISAIKEIDINTWTKIIIKELFFNTPARLNYLKKTRTEYSHILEFLNKMVLAYPKIWFEFVSDNKSIFKYKWEEDIKTRIYNIYWEEFLNNLLDINISLNWFEINWYITDPKISFPNKNRQVIFVNNRIINSPVVFRSIMNAYNRFISPKTFPGFIINLKINPTEIDVNVHPRKLEIRFANEKSIFSWIYNTIFQRLNKVTLLDNDFETGNSIKEDSNFKKDNFHISSWSKFKDYSPYTKILKNPSQTEIKDTIEFTRNILWTNTNTKISENENISNDLHDTNIWRIVWQLHNSYIIIETKNGLKILDQHALAERIIYEKLQKNENKSFVQKLLFPQSFNLMPNEIDLVKLNNKIFNNMWFDIEIMSWWIVMLNSIPDFIKKEDIKNIFLWLIKDIQEWDVIKLKTLEEVRNKIFAYTACRSAVKFWNKLNLFEMNKLLNDSVINYSSTCPHWRPVVFEVWLDDLKWKYER